MHKENDGLITLALFVEIEIEIVLIKYGFGLGWLWNAAPLQIKNANTKATAKREIKKFAMTLEI